MFFCQGLCRPVMTIDRKVRGALVAPCIDFLNCLVSNSIFVLHALRIVALFILLFLYLFSADLIASACVICFIAL